MSDHPVRRRIISVAIMGLLLGIGVMIALMAVTPGAAVADEKGSAKAGDGGAAGATPPALIRVGSVSQQDLQPRFEVIGRFRELKRTIVGSGQQGRVVEMSIEEGQVVEGGKTVLARIDPTFSNIEKLAADARLSAAKAEEAEALANLEQATRDRVYFDDLEKRQSAKAREVDLARSVEKASQAKLDRARAAIASAEQDIDRVREELIRFNITAPFDGVVVKKWMELGQWVTKGASVVELVSRGKIDAVVDVPEQHVNSLFEDEDIELLVDAMKLRVTGKIQAIVPDGTNAARTFPVKIRVDDQKGRLKPGMSMTAWLPSGEKTPTLTVPRDAVLINALGSAVWVVVEGKAMKVDVDVLYGTGDQYAVRVSRRNAGPMLSAGMQVVTEGGERLMFPGHPVRADSPLAAVWGTEARRFVTRIFRRLGE
jgi:membrane fusion protein (multidrug efflux system)